MSSQVPLPQLQKIQQLAQQGQMTQALQLSEEQLSQHPDDAQAWINHSMLLFQTGQQHAVLEAIGKARKIAPHHLPYQMHQIMALEALGQIDEAILQAKYTAELNIKELQVIDILAAFFNKHQQFDEALKLYQQALKIKPNDNKLALNLAMTHQYLGDLTAAEQLANQALERSPHDCDVHFFRSHLSKQSRKKNHIEALQKTTRQPMATALHEAKAYFALAKELEDCQQHQASFIARQKGAQVYRNSFGYDLASDLAFMQAIEDNFSAKFLQQQANGFETEEPIFIVGLPRSGTTLLERIISSHSDVFSAGELTHFNRCMLAGMQQLGLDPKIGRSQMVAASVNLDFKALGKNYLNSTRPLTGSTSRFIDKFPQNAQYVGLIHRALPQAKILILERHPLDVCYAVYKQMFTDIYQFSYDLNELAEYFIQHQKLMHHWQQSLPDVVKTVRYENLVNDFENQAKDVIQFCGLPWQEACLNFHQNQQASTTASASQVRQKIYTTSVGMWKNYEQELQPLIDQLTKAGCLQQWQSF